MNVAILELAIIVIALMQLKMVDTGIIVLKEITTMKDMKL
jgi:hypothetical protein